MNHPSSENGPRFARKGCYSGCHSARSVRNGDYEAGEFEPAVEGVPG
jgi:hypothetical protein